MNLHTFTVGHAFALRAVGSPILPDADSPDPDIWLGDLCAALVICSKPVGVNDKTLIRLTVKLARQLTRRFAEHADQWWESVLVAGLS